MSLHRSLPQTAVSTAGGLAGGRCGTAPGRHLDAQEAEPVVPQELSDERPEIPRSVLRLRAARPATPGNRTPWTSNSSILITDDGAGVADALAREIRGLGGNAVVVRHSSDAAAAQDGREAADLTDPESIAALVARVRSQHGLLSGLLQGKTPTTSVRRLISRLSLSRGLVE